MKNKILSIALFSIIFLNINISVFAKNNTPNLKADASLMIDTATDRYLYNFNEDKKIEPGGLVKIMTAIVAIENISDFSKTVTADVNVLSSYDYSFGHMGILAGEKLSYENLLNGMLLYDAGDAAEVIASTVFKTREAFINAMNNKAVEIGALNTKFTNPTGFPEKNQYSTAEDIYKITKYAMSNSYFKEIVGKSRYEMKPTNKYNQNRYLDNLNKFMNVSSTDKYYTSKAKGIKTSYISDNNLSLILQYETESMQLMIITLGSSYDGEVNYAYEDTLKLISYGLDYYTSVKVISEGDIFAEVELQNGKNTDRLLLEAKEDVFINLPKDYESSKLKKSVTVKENVKAPIKKNEILGKVEILYNDEKYVSIDLVSPAEVKADNIKGFMKKILKVITSPALLVSMGILLIIVVWSVLIFNRKKTYKIDKR